MSRSLHDVAAAFRASLPQQGITVFRVDAMDRTGVPVMQANLVQGDEPAVTGYGYGFEPIAAEVGAIGELCEEVHCGEWLKRAPRVTASYSELLRTHGTHSVIDPLTLCLPADSAYTPDMALLWVEGRRVANGETVLVPAEWVAAYAYQLGEAPRLITPITNGLGAGLDDAHAVAHGIMELLQRDGNVISFRALDQGVVIDLDDVRDPRVAALLQHLRDLGIGVTVKLAATDFGITNLYVVGDDTREPASPIQVTSCGEASHPDKHHALLKALLEFCGSRARKAATHGAIAACRAVMPADYVARQMAAAIQEEEENRALTAMVEWIGQDAAELRRRLSGCVFSERRRVSFAGLPSVASETIATGAARLNLLRERLATEGLDVIAVDCSPPDSEVRVAKVIVPGLESETMSYHRIGWRGVRRLRDRSDPLLIDAPRDGAKRVRLRPEDEARAGGPAWFDAALADRIVGALYPLYREPGPFAAQLLRQRRAA